MKYFFKFIKKIVDISFHMHFHNFSQTFSNLKIHLFICRGKYATVKRCRERSSGRQWAAKFLRKRRRAQELRAEALHEVAVLDAAANCSRLVSLHQVFETNTEMVLVLEL